MKKILLTLSLLLILVPSPLLADEPEIPTPDPVSIVLQVETASGTLFSGTLTVSPCPVSPGSNTQTVNGFCALEQSGLTNVWTWYGDDAFLDSTNSISNDPSLGNYWTWFANLELGPVALNKHQPVTNEKLLLSIGAFPLKITTSNTSPEINAPTTITVLKFSFDSNFNPVWLPASESTVHIGSYTTSPNAEGVATFTATTTDPVDIYATETGFLPTEHITLTAVTGPSAPSGSAGGGSGGGSVLPPKGDADTALAFLLQHQQSDGSFGSAMHNDWVALALSGTDKAQASLNTLLPHLLQQKELTYVTDYERRAMVLEALGIDPYAHSDTIQKIISKFDGVQIGDPNLVNDDIFSLFPLMHGGYTKEDEVIGKEVTFILSNQDQNGSWGSVDLTSAAIQALVPLSDVEGVSLAIARARDYLMSHQDTNGCFGNTYSTSWALQAISALGESPFKWTVWGGSTPLSCMALAQAPDGGFGPMEATIESRIWATAYAIPALQGKSWNTILQKFPKQNIPFKNSIPAQEESTQTTDTPLNASVSGVALGTSTMEKIYTPPAINKNKPAETVPAVPLAHTNQIDPTPSNSSTLLNTMKDYLLLMIRGVVSLAHL